MKPTKKTGKPLTDKWQYVENVDGELREVDKPKLKSKYPNYKADKSDSVFNATIRKMKHDRVKSKRNAEVEEYNEKTKKELRSEGRPYKAGGSVRGCGKAKKGVRKARMY